MLCSVLFFDMMHGVLEQNEWGLLKQTGCAAKNTEIGFFSVALVLDTLFAGATLGRENFLHALDQQQKSFPVTLLVTTNSFLYVCSLSCISR